MVCFPLDNNEEQSVAILSVSTDGEADQQATGECIYSSFIMHCVNVVPSILHFIAIIPNIYLEFIPQWNG